MEKGDEVRVRFSGAEASFDGKKKEWQSNKKAFAAVLNSAYSKWKENNMYDPYPELTALGLAKDEFPDLEILSGVEKPEYDPDAVY